MISTTTISSDDTIFYSERKPRVVIHRRGLEAKPCLSVNHACAVLGRLLARRVPKTALSGRAKWLGQMLEAREMHITFPDSRRARLPDSDSQELRGPRPALAACHP